MVVSTGSSTACALEHATDSRHSLRLKTCNSGQLHRPSLPSSTSTGMSAAPMMTSLNAARTAVNAISHGLPMTLQVGVLRMQPADACPCREPATATLTERHAARSLLEPAVTIAPSAIIAGLLMIPLNGTPLKPCADANLRRKSKRLCMAALAPIHMTCFAAQTAMTAARPG